MYSGLLNVNWMPFCRYEIANTPTAKKSINKSEFASFTSKKRTSSSAHWFYAINHNAITMLKRKFPSQTQLWNKNHSQRTECTVIDWIVTIVFFYTQCATLPTKCAHIHVYLKWIRKMEIIVRSTVRMDELVYAMQRIARRCLTIGTNDDDNAIHRREMRQVQRTIYIPLFACTSMQIH